MMPSETDKDPDDGDDDAGVLGYLPPPSKELIAWMKGHAKTCAICSRALSRSAREMKSDLQPHGWSCEDLKVLHGGGSASGNYVKTRLNYTGTSNAKTVSINSRLGSFCRLKMA